MTTITFRTDDPSLHALDVDHGAHGLLAEQKMFHPAYWDRNHPLHARCVSDVREHLALIFGEAPVQASAGQTVSFDTTTGQFIDRAAPPQPVVMAPTSGGGFAPMTWNTGPAPIDMGTQTVATGQGTPDEHQWE